ncbi:50S ribosomal protein L17 [Desulfonatronospira sp.]|uniref:50S ribosomal protein L17 n=1 Tax=Desulfonatronospira sp. TaxID=1962951 RepID=UPI0025B85680|nr:50S ribosomal protein L17 [Desulfonatronospira sp.]
MRHRKSGRSLSRNWEHRKAMFRNMAKSLVTHEKIKTTLPKAKELSKVADRLVTLALRGDLSAKREAYKVLENHKLVKRLFDDIAPRFERKNGGYTRVVKYARPRVGDNAPLALIEFSFVTSEKSTAPKVAGKPDSMTVSAPVAGSAAGTAAAAGMDQKSADQTEALHGPVQDQQEETLEKSAQDKEKDVDTSGPDHEGTEPEEPDTSRKS